MKQHVSYFSLLCALGIFALGSLLFFGAGCSPYLHSPPGQTLPLETAKALNSGETAVQVSGGGGGGDDLDFFAAAGARLSHGFGKGVEASVSADYTRIDPDVFEHKTDANVYALRLGMKYAVRDWFAVTGGLGGGGWAGGGFVSPDAGVIFSYENPYFVPFLSAGFWSSIAVSPNTLTVIGDEIDAMPDILVGKPDTIVGWYTGLGARIPFSHEKNGKTKHALLLGWRFFGGAHDEPDGRRHNTYQGGSLGFDFIFD